ncbi:TPA: BAX inhibitor (BI)-1/YccA family protein, partial [Legionella anisa]
MNRNDVTILTRRNESVLASNKVLRNTYLLLSMTFLFSAFMAVFSLTSGARPMNPLLMIVG